MLLWYLYIILLCSNIAIAVIRRKHLSPSLKVILIIIVTVLITEVVKKKLTPAQVALIEHIYFICELLLWFVYYYLLLARNKRVLLYIGLVLFLTAVLILLTVTPGYLWESNYRDFVFLAVCVSIWSGCFFYELLQSPSSTRSNRMAISGSTAVIFCIIPARYFFFGYSAYIEQVNPTFLLSLNIMNNIMNLILYILYFVAFAIARKQY